MLSRFLFHPVLIESSTSVSKTFEICMRHIIAIYPWPFSMTDFLHPSPPTHIFSETTNSQTGNGGQQQLQQHECVLVCQHGQIITTAFDSRPHLTGPPTAVARNATPISHPGSPLHLYVEFCANPPAFAARWLHGDRIYTPGNQYGVDVLAYAVQVSRSVVTSDCHPLLPSQLKCPCAHNKQISNHVRRRQWQWPSLY